MQPPGILQSSLDLFFTDDLYDSRVISKTDTIEK